ncbi:MAG: Fe-S cluster assembly protein SufD [Prevotellaceae bacterium]|nr:Fe-S cluster assembly protein SufD [Prevotellaceae bacterium]
MNREKEYIDFYRNFSKSIKENSAECLNLFRDSAFETFEKRGFPTKNEEAYLYSNLSDTLDIEYGLNINRLKFLIDKNALFHCKIPTINSTLAFMVNDNFYLPENQKNTLPKGVVFCSISQAETLYPEVVKKYFGKQSSKSDDKFVSFNSVFVQNGYFLYIQQNTKLEQPLQLINLLRSASPLMTFSHNLIVIESDTEAKMLICNHTADDVDFFANRLTEIFVEDNAKLEYYTLENSNLHTNNFSQIFLNQKDSSKVVINNLGLASNKIRNSIETDIDGSYADLLLRGIFIGSGKQETDNHTVIRHNQPHSTSNELFKYILGEQSHGVFSGRIIVNQAAQKTESHQTNKNICLTPEASMQSRPQLEIYADDVKCGHGATTGQIDNEALFYLQARGIDQKTARQMLLTAFVSDVLACVRLDVLRERLTLMVEKRLKGDNVHCNDCFIC